MTTLEKIKEEFHATAEMHEDGDYYLRDEWVNELIDKYAEQKPCDKCAMKNSNSNYCENCMCAEYRGEKVGLPTKFIKQEPCEDSVSRQAVKTELKNCEVVDVYDENDNFVGYYNADTVDSIVRNLPSVTKMRDATPEERKSVNDYIESISKPTGVNFWDLQEPCDDAISRQYLIDIATKDGAYDYVSAQEIANAPSVRPQEPKWIPVSERLPKEGEDVLACFYTGEGNYKMMVSRRSDYNYWSGVGRTADMVAWMSLPEPYEPQESDHLGK